MNFPVWELEFGGGLLIAIVAITHVFVSHFAIGGGLFLVVTEHRAYRNNDEALLNWLKRHSKVFALLTLVFGAVSGVGIWFTIGLVNPSATSALIHIFVWIWAIEWVCFFVEIAAAIIYYLTWDTIDRKTHLIIGWIYFVSAYGSLVFINGILCFMYTPGDWSQTGSLWDGFFNPTYFPALLVRTLAAIAFAGLYVFITAWREQPELRARLARWGSLWALPATVAGPLAALLYFRVAGETAWGAVRTDVPKAIAGLHAVMGSAVAYTLLLAVVILLVKKRPRIVSLPVGVLLLLFGYGSIGGAEFVRENLRKPFVIGGPAGGGYMYVNSVRATDLEATQQRGLLASSKWIVAHGEPELDEQTKGENLFRIACRGCHTREGYRDIRSQVDGKSVTTIVAMIGTLEKRRGRMPPFPGSEAEMLPLAIYLAGLDGEIGPLPEPPSEDPTARGAELLDEHCLSCHSFEEEGEDVPALRPRVAGWSADVLFEKIGMLEELNDEMIEFEGTDEERRLLAEYLIKLAATKPEAVEASP